MRWSWVNSLLLLFCIGLGMAVQAAGGGMGSRAEAGGSAQRPLDTTQNILILGSDARLGQTNWRTDTLIIAAIDWKRDQVGLLSIPRDLYVAIPGGGRDRINTVDYLGERTGYPGGGPALVNAVLAQTLGIQAPRYVRIRMTALSQMIDAVGGITVVLDAPLYENETDPELRKEQAFFTLDAGVQHLDGPTALRYIRGRYIHGDFDRNRRQQQVVWALGEQLKEVGWLSHLPTLWPIFRELVQTDLSLPDLLALAWLGARLRPEQVHGLQFDYRFVIPYLTPGGAQVLLLADRSRVDAWIDTLFSARPAGAVPASVGEQPEVTESEP